MNDNIQVAVAAPAFPLILADSAFLSTLTAVEQQVAELKISDAQSAQHAANLQQRLTTAGKKLDASRLALKRPFLDINTKIDETARGPSDRIEAAKAKLKSALTAYDAEQSRIAAEAERARQAELQRLEKLRLEEEAAATAKANELARLAAEAAAKSKAPVVEMDFGDAAPQVPPPKTETEKAIEAVKYAPAPVAAKPTGVRFKTVLVATVIDIAKVPECFVVRTANLAAIKATFCTGYKEGAPIPVCEGVRFEARREVDSMGRSQF